jgi:hypothetical protein
MATRLDITYLCDHCGKETQAQEEIYRYVVEIPTVKKKPSRMEMDLCTECAEAFESFYIETWRPEIAGLREPIRVTVGKEKDAFTTKTCKECGFEAKSLNGLGVHTVRKHGK